MPTYCYRCPHGHYFEQWLPIQEFSALIECAVCHTFADQVITAPLLVKVAQNIGYDSPVDGTIITNWHARQEDLKRHGCRPYDPDQKVEVERKRQAAEAALDKSVDESVEAAIEKMDGKTRGKLASELMDQHLTADAVRSTPTA